MNSKLTGQLTGALPGTAALVFNATESHMSSRRLQLVPPTKQASTAVIRVAFATSDRQRVNQHFGASEGFVIYEVVPGRATLVGVAEFSDASEQAMDGNENKLAAKVSFLAGCIAVYVMAIGGSAIKQLTLRGIQPIRIGEVDAVEDLLRDISTAMSEGGVAWIDRAIAAQAKNEAGDRFASMEREGWDG